MTKTEQKAKSHSEPHSASEKQDESYKVLARKYRPQHFDELIGQDTLVRTLKNAIDTGRIAHAYMLTGVRGVGKTTTARIIAKALNYTGADGKAGPTTGPTSDCEICQSIAADRHPDIMEMDAASRTGVDDIREILDGVRYAPVSARYKIYIIDEVHMLSRQAFNALLKTLEEPPEHVIFIFATTELRKVPVTVLSRCQRFDLRRIDAQTLQDYYRQICEKENVEVEDNALALISQAADGSVRDGLSLLDQAIAQAGGSDTKEKVSLDQVQNMLGLSDRGQIIGLYECALTSKTPGALEILEELFKNGADPKMVLQDLLDLTHILSKTRAASENLSKGLMMTPDKTEVITELAHKLSMPSLGRTWDILLKAMRELQFAPNPEKSVEMAIIRLSYTAGLPDPAELIRQLDTQEYTSHQDSGNTHSTSQSTSSARPQQERAAPETVSAQGSQYVAQSNEHHKGQPKNQAGHMDIRHSAHKADIQAQSAPAAYDDADQEKNNFGGFASLDEIVEVLEKHRQIRLAADIRQYVRLVSLKPDRLEFNPAQGTPKSLANEIQTQLGQITGTRWVVSISSRPGAPVLIEKERKKEAEKYERAKNHPVIQSIFNAFPGAQLKTVRSAPSEITDNNKEG